MKINTSVFRASSKLALKFEWGENHWGEKMGIKQTDGLAPFIEPESQGFISDTARSFLKRHSNPKALLAQLKQLYRRGEYVTCEDLIQLIVRESHDLADDPELYLLRAQLAFCQNENEEEMLDWIQQATWCTKAENHAVEAWCFLVRALKDLKDGDYSSAEELLKMLVAQEDVGTVAQYYLAYHYFWKNIDLEQSLFLLEELCHQNKELVKAWSCLGFVYNRLGLQQKAQMAFSHCLQHETNPEKIELYKQQLVS